MLSERENLFETLKRGGKPDRLANCYRAFQIIRGDPVNQFLRGNRIKGRDSIDRWGTLISFPEDQPGAVPIVTAQNQVIQDIEDWRQYVRVPDLRANCSEGWEAARASRDGIDRSRYIPTVIMGTGIFEQLHMLMTFEDTLCNLLMYPDEMQELIEVIADYRLEYMKLIVENLHPEAIVSHDDFGSKTSLFMAPETWREFFKEPYRRLYGYLHENGVLVVHHSDSFCEPIAEDMAEIGIDIWQGVLPTNDIPALTRRLNGRMALMGGIDSAIDRADASEKEVRAEVRRALAGYGMLPYFIPSYTYGGPSMIFPALEPIVWDEIERYNQRHRQRKIH